MLTFISIMFSFAAMFSLGCLVGYTRGLQRGYIGDRRLYESCTRAARCEVLSLREQNRILRDLLEEATHGDPMR